MSANLDALEDKWLKPDYHLHTLAQLVQSACHSGGYHQLVTGVTRSQFNSVTGEMDMSCIDHVYTTSKFRCSEVSIISFGGSDHDLLSYTRFSKEPPAPARTIRKRSYKKFDTQKFISDLSKVDWSEVYQCAEVDLAVD